jgi:hypothetical protein
MAPEFSLMLILLTITCELIMLGFLIFISNFYEKKFNVRTYFISYALPAAIFILLLASSVIFGALSLYWAALITNISILIVLSTFGFMLYSKMMGVSR